LVLVLWTEITKAEWQHREWTRVDWWQHRLLKSWQLRCSVWDKTK